MLFDIKCHSICCVNLSAMLHNLSSDQHVVDQQKYVVFNNVTEIISEIIF